MAHLSDLFSKAFKDQVRVIDLSESFESDKIPRTWKETSLAPSWQRSCTAQLPLVSPQAAKLYLALWEIWLLRFPVPASYKSKESPFGTNPLSHISTQKSSPWLPRESLLSLEHIVPCGRISPHPKLPHNFCVNFNTSN